MLPRAEESPKRDLVACKVTPKATFAGGPLLPVVFCVSREPKRQHCGLSSHSQLSLYKQRSIQTAAVLQQCKQTTVVDYGGKTKTGSDRLGLVSHSRE